MGFLISLITTLFQGKKWIYQKFRHELVSIGIISYNEQERLWDIAKRCVKMGIPTAGAGAVLGAQLGTVALPLIGTISSSAAGALAGLFLGTLMCTSLNL